MSPNLKVGDTVEASRRLGRVRASICFDGLEGLAHISGRRQRIDHPRDVLTLGQTVKVQDLNVEGSKIFSSMKRLVNDPWNASLIVPRRPSC